ncbi:hypothetical protein OR1_00905 [Geobacter sp. OR-1]|uniref:AbiTii domain-containing protein n=1 Tax=Geobacter sp. OR-1 TaxID=1266765 RepID=UPI000542A9E3|nr:hypothetical protein [Geobacter sp. OR-1]GAM08633.1 hypothetical protein OR1_00905 [Geobacter sp. OR-1]
MTSLVLELQKSAMDQSQEVAAILRKAMVVASKLRLHDFRDWCSDEMNGYSERPIPPYRKVHGQLKAHNPYNGWIPVIMEDVRTQELLSQRAVGQAISELEHLIKDKNDGNLQVPLPHNILMEVFGNSESFQLGMVPTLLVGRNQVAGIVQAVRNKVLEWSLELEQNGILGEGMTFSADEVKLASGTVYNIGTFSGVIGDVTSSNLQVGNYNSLHPELKRRGVPQAERNQLEEILDELPEAKGPQKEALLKKGISWVTRNAKELGTLSAAIRAWFE